MDLTFKKTCYYEWKAMREWDEDLALGSIYVDTMGDISFMPRGHSIFPNEMLQIGVFMKQIQEERDFPVVPENTDKGKETTDYEEE